MHTRDKGSDEADAGAGPGVGAGADVGDGEVARKKFRCSCAVPGASVFHLHFQR